MSFAEQTLPTDSPLLRAAEAAVERGDLQRADALFLEHIAQEPGDPIGLGDYGVFCMRTRRAATACYLLYKAGALRPDDGELSSQLGYAWIEVEDFERARSSFEAALAGSPGHAMANYGLGLCHQHDGTWPAAASAFEQALAAQPGTLPILLNLAEARHRAGDAVPARIDFEHAMRLAPDDPATLLEYGKFLRERGETSRAMQLIDRCAQQHPDELPVILEKARCLRLLGDSFHAMRWLERLNRMWPDLPECQQEFGMCLEASSDHAMRDLHWIAAINRWIGDGDFQHAEPLLEKLQASNPRSARAWNLRGLFENALQHLDAAEQAYRKAMAEDARYLDAYANLAQLYELSNRVVESRTVAEAGLRLGNLDGQRHATVELNLALCRASRRLKDYPSSLDALDRIDAMEPAESQKLFSLFERGRLMDLCDEPAKAVEAFASGNALALAPWLDANRGPNKFLAGVDYMLDLAGKGWLRQWNPIDLPPTSPRLAFLVGFPRSGTTLLNQVLDSHGAIETMEEKPPASKIMDAVRCMPKGYPHALPDFDALDVAWLREAYFRSAAEHGASDPSKLLFDKFPLHITMADLLHRVFPQARFVFALRHPCDVVLSCFMQNFRLNDAMANFCTLADTVALYIRTMDLWEMYRTQLPLLVHTVRYEDIVDDFDGQVRALCEFLDVPWEDGVRQFATRALDRGRINTPSYEQVSQPIYRQARYRWERYREHLAPFLPALQPYIERFGYSADRAG